MQVVGRGSGAEWSIMKPWYCSIMHIPFSALYHIAIILTMPFLRHTCSSGAESGQEFSQGLMQIQVSVQQQALQQFGLSEQDFQNLLMQHAENPEVRSLQGRITINRWIRNDVSLLQSSIANACDECLPSKLFPSFIACLH